MIQFLIKERDWMKIMSECAIKKEIKALSPTDSGTLKDKAKKAVEGVKETVKKAVNSVPNF